MDTMGTLEIITTIIAALTKIGAIFTPNSSALAINQLCQAITNHCTTHNLNPANVVAAECATLPADQRAAILSTVNQLLTIPDMTTNPLTAEQITQAQQFLNAIHLAADGNVNFYEAITHGLILAEQADENTQAAPAATEQQPAKRTVIDYKLEMVNGQLKQVEFEREV